MKQKPWETKIPKPKKFKDIKKPYRIFEHHVEHGWKFIRFVDVKWLTQRECTVYILKGYILDGTVIDNAPHNM